MATTTIEGHPIARIFDTAEAAAAKKTADSVILDRDAEDALPKFELTELKRGRVLGRGYFCVVQEITSIRLHASNNDPHNVRVLQDEHAIHNATQNRQFMALHSMRGKECRYAMKVLQDSSKRTVHDYVNGLTDLATEARFLAVVRHPNIVKIRGMCVHGPFNLHHPYFLVLDRLYDTLSVRISKWKKQRPSRIFPKRVKEFWVERLEAVFDLCTAFQYLHEQNIIYRDLKPDNVGFDVRGTNDAPSRISHSLTPCTGDIKLFDFGLAKELHPSERLSDGMYHLTSDTGSPRYMAPEVYLGKPYNETADVYSMSILTWQMMALEAPFLGYNMSVLAKNVYHGNSRPKCDPRWSPVFSDALRQGWGPNHKRPSMKAFIEEIRKDISAKTGSYYVGGSNILDNSHRGEGSRHGARTSNIPMPSAAPARQPMQVHAERIDV